MPQPRASVTAGPAARHLVEAPTPDPRPRRGPVGGSRSPSPGLIRRTRTRQNRGTLEKYFLAVARRFEVGEALLGGGSEDALTTMIDTLLDQTRNECHRLAAGDLPLDLLLEKSGLLTFAEVHADQKTIDRLTKRLRRVVDDLVAEGPPEDPDVEPERRYRVLLAYYPLDRFPDE